MPPLQKPRSEGGELPCDRQLWLAIAEELGLTSQQQRIVELILRGRQDKEIAETMEISIPTVRTHLTRIYSRVEVSDRLELILRVFAMAQERCTMANVRRQQ